MKPAIPRMAGNPEKGFPAFFRRGDPENKIGCFRGSETRLEKTPFRATIFFIAKRLGRSRVFRLSGPRGAQCFSRLRLFRIASERSQWCRSAAAAPSSSSAFAFPPLPRACRIRIAPRAYLSPGAGPGEVNAASRGVFDPICRLLCPRSKPIKLYIVNVNYIYFL